MTYAKKLGLNPHGLPDEALLRVGWAAGQVPAYEPKLDRLASITIGLDGNDKYGDCGPTASDNHDRVNTFFLTGTETDAPQAAVFDLYSRSTHPPFDPATGANDNGVDMVTMFKALKTGGLNGRKIVAYAKLKDMSDPSIFAAIDLFGAVIFAVDLQVAQQGQTDSGFWDYVQSDDWGGHAIVAASYDSTTGDIWVGTWGEKVRTTRAFRQHQLQEVWVPIWPELLGAKRFVDSVDGPTLAADFASLTGGGVLPIPAPTPPPAPIPPLPGPTPLPPDPGAASFLVDDPRVVAHVDTVAGLRRTTPDAWLTLHLQHYFHLSAAADAELAEDEAGGSV